MRETGEGESRGGGGGRLKGKREAEGRKKDWKRVVLTDSFKTGWCTDSPGWAGMSGQAGQVPLWYETGGTTYSISPQTGVRGLGGVGFSCAQRTCG